MTESVDDGWLEKQVARNGTREAGGFTEAYLSEEGFVEEARRREVGPALPAARLPGACSACAASAQGHAQMVHVLQWRRRAAAG